MTITTHPDTCRCGHEWHEEKCGGKRTVAVPTGAEHVPCKCKVARPLTDPATISPSRFYGQRST